MSRACRFIAWFAPLLILPYAGPLNAQTIRGQLVESESGRPISGAIVVLLDEETRQVAGVLSNDAGGFIVRAPGPGAYRLRADRIGYASTLSPRLELSAGETRDFRFGVSTRAVELEGITASGEARCDLRPAEGLETQRVWEEARKALAATALTTEGGLHRFRIVGYERELDPQASRIRSERSWSKVGHSENPFVTLPPEVLAAEGYARTGPEGTILYAPDARVLLSDSFLDTHCFGIDFGGEERAGQIGLSFNPVHHRDLTDVEGVLWVDRKTAELRSLEYRYTTVDPSLPQSRLGGRLEFERLPGGSWITRRWWIRMPITAAPPAIERQFGGWERMVLVGIKEDGGEVVEVLSPGGTRVSGARKAILSGLVFDSSRSAPLAGATVFISGTQYSAATDERGRFRIEGFLDGEYSVSFMHPKLDSLGTRAPLRAVSLRAGEESVADLAVPSREVGSVAAPDFGRPDPRAAPAPVGRAGEEVEVVEEPRHVGLLAGFHERKARGFGIILTREDIDRRRAVRFNDILRGVPGIVLISTPAGEFPSMTGATGRIIDEGGACPIQYYLDGSAFEPAILGTVTEIRPQQIEGLEIYRRLAEVPAEYRMLNAECGVILIWLRQQ
jgi:hypothetical protein